MGESDVPLNVSDKIPTVIMMVGLQGAAAILSAVEDATGVRFEETPLTPGRVLAGLKAAGKI